MEVADQWRREWAGTAEYGQVVEGGVTRQIARAMEVLNASGPGARVRVMRAAYHSSAGPGAPASSYMVHSSRRVISSGFNFMDPPSLPSKPLEISSMPLELSEDSHTDTGNYKVTEPDDSEISEPSKWKSSLGGSTIRMPSEESSSTDNASIIDLDSKINKNSVFRKYSYDSENSDIPMSSGRNSRVSPLLDAPVALSTLRFKSLLNNNSDWNNRRKSYSFEDTSPISETIMHSNDTLAMESSTDSGICKSTELVNGDNTDENKYKYFKSRDKDKPNDTFQNWLANNKQSNYYKDKKFKPYKNYDVDEDPAKNNITLQSSGKVSITLPIAIETDEGYVYRNNQTSDEGNKRIKKVEFCKTELHFAAETGRVNIISTDDKPPPSNDFRKRRSAFVPLRDMSEKPITLFGDKLSDFSNDDDCYTINDFNENDENTAATKSILKNKIPKPKPYLLGENMEFGNKADYYGTSDADVPTAVSLINRQLQAEKWSDNKITSKVTRQEMSSFKNSFRTINQGLNENNESGEDICDIRNEYHKADEEPNIGPITKIHIIKRSPTPGQIKTRELRESDLTYFGVNNHKRIEKPTPIKIKQERSRQTFEDSTNLFQSVKLIQQVSNSICNSESEDSPEYQNIPFNKSYVPKPTPRIRSKFDDKPNEIDEIKVIKPIIERAKELTNDDSSLKRSKHRKEDFKTVTNRSRSEPRKSYNTNSIERSHRRVDQSTRSTEKTQRNTKLVNKDKNISDDDTPLYVNLNKYNVKNILGSQDKNSLARKSSSLESARKTDSTMTHKKDKTVQDADVIRSSRKNNNNEKKKDNFQKKTEVIVKNNKGDDSPTSRTHVKYIESTKQSNKAVEVKPARIQDDSLKKLERKSRSLQRNKKTPEENEETIRRQAKQSKDKSTNEFPNDNKISTRPPSKNDISSRNEVYKVIPKVKGSVSNKGTASKDSSARSASRSKRNQYVINYDDKNGTVSSVTKIRSDSGSPKRKPVNDTTREKFRENLKNKASDKVALLQSEDHQRNWMNSELKRKSKVRLQRTCQIM